MSGQDDKFYGMDLASLKYGVLVTLLQENTVDATALPRELNGAIVKYQQSSCWRNGCDFQEALRRSWSTIPSPPSCLSELEWLANNFDLDELQRRYEK